MSTVTKFTAWSVPVKPRFEHRRVGGTTIYAGSRLAEGAASLDTRTLGLDTETCGVKGQARWQCKCIALSDGPTALVADPRDPAQVEVIRAVIEAAGELVVHNAQFDLPILTDAGICDTDTVERVTDTLVLSRAADPGRQSHSLSDLAADLLGVPRGDAATMYADAGVRSASEWYETIDIDYAPYLAQAATDAAVLPRLRDFLTDRTVALWTSNPYTGYGLDDAGARAVLDDFQTAARVMLRASCTGLDVDFGYVDGYAAQVESVIADCQAALHAHGVIEDVDTPATPAQIAAYVDRSGLAGPDYPRTAGGALSTAKADLAEVGGLSAGRDGEGLIPADASGDPAIVAYLVARERRKVRDAYLAPLRGLAHPVTGRIYPQVEMLGAARTGRMAAKNPAVQQWPAAARPAVDFRDIPGGCVSIDWSSIEPVIAMAVSGEHGPLAGFLNEGKDLYIPTARAAGLIPEDIDDASAHDHPGRKQAKITLLALLYGKGSKRLADDLGVDPSEAVRIRDAILGALPSVGAWMKALRSGAETTGVTMTAAGRVVPIARDERGQFKGYLAQNYFHQGSASDVLTSALVEIHRRGLAGAVRMAVHDELIVDAEAAAEITDVMENAAGACVAHFAGLSSLPLRTESHPLPEHWALV